MNAEDLLLIAAAGFGVWYVMNQSATAAAASPSSPAPSPNASPMIPAAPVAPSINVQPSTIPLSNPIASLTPPAPVPLAPSPGPAPAPPAPVMATPPPNPGMTLTIQPYGPVTPFTGGPMQVTNTDPIPSPTASGPVPPPPTVQPGIVPTPAAPVSSIQVAPAPTPAPAPFVPPPVVYNPVLAYQFSRNGGTLYPGDTWTVNISGAKPGSTVAMSLSQNGGNAVNNTMGTVNSSGTFSYTGTVNTGTDGQWSQLWFLNGSTVGVVQFTAFDPVVNAVVPVATYNSTLPNTPIGTPANPTQGPLIIGGTVYQTGTLWI